MRGIIFNGEGFREEVTLKHGVGGEVDFCGELGGKG